MRRNLIVGAGSEHANYTITEPDAPDAGRHRLLAIMRHKVRAEELAKPRD